MPNLTPVHGTPAQRMQCLLGLLAFILIAFLIGRIRPTRNGEPRAAFPWRVVIWGVILQFAFAGIVLWTPKVLEAINDVVNALLNFTRAGAELVFGNLATVEGAPVFKSD